ncbi:DUF4401 domain-containing protein [Olleya sp. HaHaR_3_96]|uniref:DUF4401 domain-containing protein n=1 Tax=Olleya sp. HaHaR_3_96 TaxID=2745560 RepID=UPI001C4E5B54|nr:DUF4401 domain-containing protein [Olleya sp. HaHaR_3_96]QXP59443.1 DUF4401 domain-containing protein [Olleya sp. HaHaR_3_96]
MDKLNNKKAFLAAFSASQGPEFEYNEKAILEDYNIQGENKSSLTIKILTVIGGFLATLAFLAFLLIAGLYNSEEGLLVFGALFIIIAIWLNTAYDTLIIDTFSISAYIIGFVLLAFGLSEMQVDINIVTVVISLIAIISLFITQNYILSFISILTISCSFLTLILFNNLYDLIHLYIVITTLLLTYIFSNEALLISSNVKISKLYNPSRIGLIIALLFGLIAVGKKHIIPLLTSQIWLPSIVMFGVIIYLVYRILKIINIKTLKSSLLIYTLSCLILIPLVFSPSILGALIIILLSFLVNYKTGLAIGIISFIYFISQYYYDLNYTLLIKSIILFSSGIIFLIFYLFTSKIPHSNEKI